MLKFFRTNFFPMSKSESRNFKYKAIIGIGGNQNDVIKTFKKLFRLWMDDKRVRIVKTSLILKNPPFGFTEQEDFYNSILMVQTSLSAKSFLKVLLHTEKKFGRKRSFKNAPRTLDLDIIMFNGFESKDKKLTLPHPKWQERVSVIAPLMAMEI